MFDKLRTQIINCGNDNVHIDTYSFTFYLADPGGHAVYGVGLRPLACWGNGFESSRGHRCLYLVIVVCCTGIGLCDGPITLQGESAVCVCVCVSLSVVGCNSNLLH